MRILVIPVATKDASGNSPTRDELEKTFFGSLMRETNGGSASVADYFRDASSRAVSNVSGKVLEWIKVDNSTESYFTAGAKVPSRDFFEEVFRKADAVVDYAEFDDDKVEGDRSGSQNDGFVDIVVIVVDWGPGYFDAFRWKMSLTNTPDSPPWTSNDEEILGTPGLGVTEKVKVKIDDFILIPSDRLRDGRIGVACHEIMHFLGLPDLYNRNDWRLGGVGQWCLMCLGCNEMVNTEGTVDLGPSAKFPPILAPWCRAQLGWGNEVKPDANGVAKLRSRQTTGDYLVVQAPDIRSGVPSSEAMYIEYYTPPNNTSPWGKNVLPDNATGFLVWHADNDVGRNGADPSFVWPSAAPSHGQNDAVFGWPLGTDHPLLRLIEADGELSLEKGTSNYSDPKVLFSNQPLQLNKGDAGFTWYVTAAVQLEVVFNVSLPTVRLLAANPVSTIVGAPASTGSTMPSSTPTVAAPSAPGLASSTGSTAGWSARLSGPKWAAEGPAKSESISSGSLSRDLGIDPKTSRLVKQLKQYQTEIAANEKDVPKTRDAEFRQLSKVIEQNGGADGKFAKDLSKAVSVAASDVLDRPSGSARDLKSISYRSMENTVDLVGAQRSAELLANWEQARTRNATASDAVVGFYGKYVNWTNAQEAKTVLSPDGTSVVKLSATGLSIDPLDTSPEIDTAKRLWDIKTLSGVTDKRVALQIDKERTRVDSASGPKVYLIFVAHLGEKELPLNTRENFAVVSYGEGNRLQNIEFNRPVVVKQLPETVEPQRSVQQIIDDLRLRLGPQAPRSEDLTHQLELVLDPYNTATGKWIPAYRIDLPLPTGPKQVVYFDANTGARLE